MDDFEKNILRFMTRRCIQKVLDDIERDMDEATKSIGDDADAHEINAMFKEEIVTQISERFGSLKVIEDMKGGEDK